MSIFQIFEHERTCLEETGSVAVGRYFAAPIGAEYRVGSKWVDAVVVDCQPESGSADRSIITLRAIRAVRL